MNALSTAVEKMRPIECNWCDDGYLLEAGDVLVCNECGQEAVKCPHCNRMTPAGEDNTVCEWCEYHFCNKCKQEMRPATYYKEGGQVWLNTEAYCYKCEGVR